MNKIFVLKTGDFYLSKYLLDSEKIETSFISGLIFTADKEKALKLPFEKAGCLKDMLYITTGVKYEMKEVSK